MCRLLPIAFAVFAAACVDPLELPDTPPVAHLVEAYDNPTAELTEETAEAIVTGYTQRVLELDQVGGLRPLLDTLVALDEQVEATENDDGEPRVEIGGVPLDADAVLTIAADCPGGADGVPVRGAIAMQLIARDSELVPIAWGDILGCELVVDDRETVLDATLVAFLPTLLERAATTSITYIEVDVTALAIEDVISATWTGDFRIVDDALELRVLVADAGHVIASASVAGAIGVRAANGAWTCFVQERRCERDGSPPESVSY